MDGKNDRRGRGVFFLNFVRGLVNGKTHTNQLISFFHNASRLISNAGFWPGMGFC